jgi:hypothetical protein
LKLYPETPKIWLHLLAGIMWSGVGLLLVSMGLRWLAGLAMIKDFLIILSGLVLALVIYYFGFSKLAKTNMGRIESYQKERVCVFAFQKWSTYPLVIFMILLGIYLRLFSPIPKQLLAILYFGIGGSLFFSSVHYYNKVLSKSKEKS